MLDRSTTLVPTRLGRIAVHELGSGPVAVLWHSMFVDSSSWDRVVEPLSAHRRLLVVDGPGYGRSDELRRTSTIAEAARAAEDLLDVLGVTEPVDWVGNAWGGHLGYQLAGTSPQRLATVVAISAPPLALPRAERRKLRVLSYVVRAVGPIAVLRKMIAEAQLTEATRANDPEAVGYINRAVQGVSRRSLANTLRSFIVGRTDLAAEAAAGTMPYLFLASDDRGEMTPEDAQTMADQCADATVHVVRGARTLVPLEQPAAVVEEILSFWQRHQRR
ncbi:MAG: alpha/beta hydrolase [Propionibacteriaceae bacterium]